MLICPTVSSPICRIFSLFFFQFLLCFLFQLGRSQETNSGNMKNAFTAKSNRRRVKSWMKNHPMEGDDIITSFYDLLCKRDPKTMKPCRNVFVPDTVVYEHNFPRGWYTTDVRGQEIVRRQGKDLDAATIELGFSREVAENFPIVATYLSIHEEILDNGVTETTTRVQVLNKDDIGAFVARKNKSNGILQRFVFPKGYHNSVIKVVWSPRIAMIQRRTNKYPIKDRKRAESDPFVVTVTYEGPEYLSEESGVSAHVAFEVKNVCAEIIKHFFHAEHKYITRMVLYFKSDGKDRLWFLWCGSLRVAERATQCHMPMNLAPRFGEPMREGSLSEQEMLRRVDKAYYVITRDGPFCDAYLRGNDSHSDVSSDRRSTRGAKARDCFLSEGKESDSLQSKRFVEEEDLPPELENLLVEMRKLEEMVLETFADKFYNAYSYFLGSTYRPFELVVPPNVVNVLTQSSTRELMEFLMLEKKPEAEGKAPARPEGGAAAVSADPEGAEVTEESRVEMETDTSEQPMVYFIPEKHRLPISLLRERTEKWIKELFSSRYDEVRKDYVGHTEGAHHPEGESTESDNRANVKNAEKFPSEGAEL
ncbi:hypothetical protein, conserved [Trypanosoma brucei gambiense DAL972]|uniref:T. brucei spp.-specific protein n=1 Tax=Trypanosoma brucei gambiense (strain MHOM/CI/86/DAL972) TaxID=679716 RepID=C9ZM74_TRYB9|nr:hypothetical protein, conserved [Trypanosoma brucei gambiense DAL972]CBH10747.1 hypothetical protein, conserved [Trypanosoma brucei gambiense DAL972]|eukprot:XP_011773035.1 hypothetical protein, conserved [Trypanosoma brucei gambiense DAL972]